MARGGVVSDKHFIIARSALVILLAVAATAKLRDPARFLDPLRDGLDFTPQAAGMAFVAVIAAVSVAVWMLVRRPRAGLILTGLFLLAGGVYALVLEQREYQGSCGCGVAEFADSANPLRSHAYMNTACAGFCMFLGFRARPGGSQV